MMKYVRLSLLLAVFMGSVFNGKVSGQFVHPGIYQTKADLEYMKSCVANGDQPWKDAFERLREKPVLDFKIQPHAHVFRGPYGRPNIGGDDLRKGAEVAYDCALLWYITGERAYADKARAIIQAWSPVLWDLDYNDAKLLAGWTGHMFCNAAEILRYTDSGWGPADTEAFTRMLMTVYYPLMRFYYPQANGNWDGAIIQSILAIAVFTDNQEMYDNAIGHLLYAPVNGSLFKYIWPSGQCQETTRDQAHVQLGLGEFAGAARIAYTQGMDIFSLAGNRLALGYEYTASFLLGEKPFSYGVISERAKDIRDDYEYVFRHYTSKGVDVSFTGKAADAIREKTSRSTLTAFRAPSGDPVKKQGTPQPCAVGYPAGARDQPVIKAPASAIRVQPGESLQQALDKAAGTGGWVVAAAGVHVLPATLKIPSGITLAGEGLGTILFSDPASGDREAMANRDPDMSDVTIRDLVVEGATSTEVPSDPNSRRSYRSTANRGGIMFYGNREGQLKRIRLENVTVRNCTWSGVFLNAVEDLTVSSCDFSESGASVVPGPRLQHNLLITRCTGVVVENSRLVNSPQGCGVAVANSRTVKISGNEVARNGWYGVLLTESEQVTVDGNLVEANDRSGIMAEYLHAGCRDIAVTGNTVHFNNGYGIETYAAADVRVEGNAITWNRNKDAQVQISTAKNIIMN